MKWYLGNIPIFKLGSIFYLNGKKYKVINNKLNNSSKQQTAIGVKVIDNNSSNS